MPHKDLAARRAYKTKWAAADRKANPERHRDAQKRYRKAHPALVNARRRTWLKNKRKNDPVWRAKENKRHRDDYAKNPKACIRRQAASDADLKWLKSIAVPKPRLVIVDEVMA